MIQMQCWKYLSLGELRKDPEKVKCYFIKKVNSREMCIDHLLLAIVTVIMHLTLPVQTDEPWAQRPTHHELAERPS